MVIFLYEGSSDNPLNDWNHHQANIAIAIINCIVNNENIFQFT